MITKSIPGQLAYQTVILVKIVSAMREDYIGCEKFLEFLEALFDRRTEVGKETISKRFHHDSFLCARRRNALALLSASLPRFGLELRTSQ